MIKHGGEIRTYRGSDLKGGMIRFIISENVISGFHIASDEFKGHRALSQNRGNPIMVSATSTYSVT